jgi:hypothetical protein
MGFYAATSIKASDETHLHPVHGLPGTFDWVAKPVSGGKHMMNGGMLMENLGPGFAHEFAIQVSGGKATPIVDDDEGRISSRITLNAKVKAAKVSVFFKGKPFKEFQVPLAAQAGSLSPNTGPEKGGTTVSIHGTNFVADSKVLFGEETLEITSINKTQTKILVTSPPGKGIVPVRIVNSDGAVATVPTGFTYEPGDHRCCSEEGKNPLGTSFRPPKDEKNPIGTSLSTPTIGDPHKH